MQTDIGKNVILVHRKGGGATEITTSFVVAHGTMMNASFGIDRRTTLFFPWGVGHFGWYEKDVGCPLQPTVAGKCIRFQLDSNGHALMEGSMSDAWINAMNWRDAGVEIPYATF